MHPRIAAYAPGYTVYNSIAEEACLVQKETCYANDQCWQRDNKRHRFMLHGITVVFQVRQRRRILWQIMGVYNIRITCYVCDIDLFHMFPNKLFINWYHMLLSAIDCLLSDLNILIMHHDVVNTHHRPSMWC